MDHDKETTVNNFIESATSYSVVVVSLLLTSILEHASDAITIGSLVLLSLRLYVDGGKALDKWRGKDGK